MTTKVPAGTSPEDVPEHPTLYWILWYSGWAIVAALLLVSVSTWNVTFFDQYGITFNGGPTALLAAIAFLFLSYTVVGADELAGSYCWNKALVRLVSGPHLVWFLLMQVRIAPRPVQQRQYPGEPEEVQKGPDKDPLDEGKVRPIRPLTRAPTATETGILDTQMALEISFVVQYAVTDIFDFVANYGGSLSSVEKQLRDIGEIVIAEETTRHTPASFITALPATNKMLLALTRKRFKQSGINIISVRLITPDLSHDVTKELANIPIARAKAEQMKIMAAGKEVEFTREGTGKANAKAAMLSAEAKGRKEMKDALEVTGDAVLASESARGILAETDVLLLGEGGMRDAMGLVKAAQSALKSGTVTVPKGAKP